MCAFDLHFQFESVSVLSAYHAQLMNDLHLHQSLIVSVDCKPGRGTVSISAAKKNRMNSNITSAVGFMY